jgi:hypothetical protein
VQAEEEPIVVAVVEEPSAAPPPVATTAVEEGQTAVETSASQADLEPSAEAGPSGADVMVVASDEDSVPPPPVGGHGVVMTLVYVPSLAAEVPEPSRAAGAVEPSSAMSFVTVEEVMELATHQYINFPGVGIVDLDTRSFRAMTGRC